MFSKKRKSYRGFLYTAIVITSCALIVAIFWPDPVNTQNANGNLNMHNDSLNNQANTGTDINYEIDKNNNNNDNDVNDDENINKLPSITPDLNSYYLVKQNEGKVKVYFVDSNSNQIELETTDIVYDVLGPSDQSLFDKGIVLNSQEELYTLLQDFES